MWFREDAMKTLMNIWKMYTALFLVFSVWCPMFWAISLETPRDSNAAHDIFTYFVGFASFVAQIGFIVFSGEKNK